MPQIVLIALCLQTTGIENGVRQYSGFSSALALQVRPERMNTCFGTTLVFWFYIKNSSSFQMNTIRIEEAKAFCFFFCVTIHQVFYIIYSMCLYLIKKTSSPGR